MVINTNPCYIYCLNSNTLVDHLTVVAHATGHNDFFKNNIHFSGTDTNMMNKMANHGTRIRRYMTRWGKERVIEFIDHVLRLETLVDSAKAWEQRVIKDRNLVDHRTPRQPRRLQVDKQRMYMEPFINTKEFRAKENSRIAKEDAAEEIGLFGEPTKDILGFIRDNAPLKAWQADIVAMLYEESLYFYPQRQTKVCNEGWASFTDHEIMARQGYVALGQKSHDVGIVEYAAHKTAVLGGKYSTNPYKLGYSLLLDIEERWNKGRFGAEWEDCDDVRKKAAWDTGANLGKEKIFEVRKYYDDFTLINEFFTEDFCREQEYFHWKHHANGETRIEDFDYKAIKKALMKRHLNGGLPEIKLTEPNYRGKGYLMLQHDWEGRTLYDPYIRDVLASLYYLWNNNVYLSSKNKDNDDIVYCCSGTDPDKLEILSHKNHIGKW
jgi:stage V sporulation protein R